MKYPCVLNKKRILHPLMSTSTMSISPNYNNAKGGDKHIAKRILSAKDHRIKQLQNQLADAHFHLNVKYFFFQILLDHSALNAS